MLREASNSIEMLLSRRSVPALQLREPGPSQAQIDIAIDAALRAPDHGALKPLRLVLIRGAARARLSELFVRRLQQREPATPPGKLDKARDMPLSAPLVLAVGARLRQDHKVPEVEQLLATGAAVMNLLNAFHAQGYGAIWLTGGNAYDPEVAAALAFDAQERCLGFVYVGSIPVQDSSPPRTPERAAFVRDWSG
ncbi:MAG TPA: nitroreductase [Steroidobacteraceae bacterium]|jgi:nitroreductase|nr:nitroreductase [Steroidobacteraceae bacterium]